MLYAAEGGEDKFPNKIYRVAWEKIMQRDTICWDNIIVSTEETMQKEGLSIDCDEMWGGADEMGEERSVTGNIAYCT